ncbi:MAG: hypothetical protein VX322_01345, partial [Actinomycetota bacterium]|nr:hypothetical protein [Actinomycetota bacterium]
MSESPAAFGSNEWLVEEMYERFCTDADAVGDSWKEFFSDYRPNGQTAVETTAPTSTPSSSVEVVAPAPAVP